MQPINAALPRLRPPLTEPSSTLTKVNEVFDEIEPAPLGNEPSVSVIGPTTPPH